MPPLYLADGGIKDRTGIHDWATAAWTSAATATDEATARKGIVHLVDSSSRLESCD